MRKRFDGITFLKRQKKLIIKIAAGVAAICIVVGGCLYVKSGRSVNSGEYENEIAMSDANAVVSEEVKDYVSNYFQTTEISEYISNEDMAKIIAEISSGVLNSLPVDTLSAGQEQLVRELITEAVTEAITEVNQTKDTTNVSTSVITEDLLSYINQIVVPRITAEIQISNGAIDDLKDSLSKISSEYSSNKENYDAIIADLQKRMQNMQTNGASNADVEEIQKVLDQLSIIFANYKSSNSAEVTSLEAELLAAIEANKTASDAADADLQEQIHAQGRLTDNELTALKANLLGQLEANSELSERERQQLADAIASLDNSTASDISAVKDYLLQELGTTNTNITSAVTNLNADLSSIRSIIEANKTASDAADADLQNKIDSINNSIGTNNSNTTIYEQITNIQNQLGGWSLEERGGHLWAVMYDDETGAELQAKKLTFAQ